MNSDFKELLQIFEQFEVEYLVVGGYAVMVYTEPRYTKDLDLWVRPEPSNALRVFKGLAKFGAPLGDVKPQDFATEGLVYQMGVEPVRIDILMSIDGVDFGEAWQNKRRVSLGDCQQEMRRRHRDLADVENIQTSLGMNE